LNRSAARRVAGRHIAACLQSQSTGDFLTRMHLRGHPSVPAMSRSAVARLGGCQRLRGFCSSVDEHRYSAVASTLWSRTDRGVLDHEQSATICCAETHVENVDAGLTRLATVFDRELRIAANIRKHGTKPAPLLIRYVQSNAGVHRPGMTREPVTPRTLPRKEHGDHDHHPDAGDECDPVENTLPPSDLTHRRVTDPHTEPNLLDGYWISYHVSVQMPLTFFFDPSNAPLICAPVAFAAINPATIWVRCSSLAYATTR